MFKIIGFFFDFCLCFIWFKFYVRYVGFLIFFFLLEIVEVMDVFFFCVVFIFGLVFIGFFIVVVVVVGFGCRVFGFLKLSGLCLFGDVG